MMPFNTLLCIMIAFVCTWIAPVIFAVMTGRKNKGYLTAVMCGVIAGLISALITRNLPFGKLGMGGLLLTAFVTAAAYFGTRVVIIKLCSLHSHGVSLGYGAGVGQGMMAQFATVGILYLNNTVYGIMLYLGTFHQTLERAGVNAEQTKQMADTLTGTSAFLYLMSGCEQFCVIGIAVLGGFVLTWFMENGKFFIGCVVGFALEFGFRWMMLLLNTYAGQTVQYMAITGIALLELVSIYLTLFATTTHKKNA